MSDSEGATTETTMHIDIIENSRDELSNFDFTNELPGTLEGWEYYSSSKRHQQISLINGITLCQHLYSTNNQIHNVLLST